MVCEEETGGAVSVLSWVAARRDLLRGSRFPRGGGKEGLTGHGWTFCEFDASNEDVESGGGGRKDEKRRGSERELWIREQMRDEKIVQRAVD